MGRVVTRLKKVVTRLGTVVTRLRKMITSFRRVVTRFRRVVTRLRTVVTRLRKLVSFRNLSALLRGKIPLLPAKQEDMWVPKPICRPAGNRSPFTSYCADRATQVPDS